MFPKSHQPFSFFGARFFRLLASSASTATLALACADEEPLPQQITSATPSNDVYASVCPDMTARLRECNLLSEGEFRCTAQVPEDICQGECIVNAPCEEIQRTSCSFDETATRSCLDRCIQESPTAFDCGNGTKVRQSYACDGFQDCSNGADEGDCPTVPCAHAHWDIPESAVCDGFDDCLDGSDEMDCGDGFSCGDGDSIPEQWQCDGQVDCNNGADEQDCVPEAQIICD